VFWVGSGYVRLLLLPVQSSESQDKGRSPVFTAKTRHLDLVY